jgi:hypothetical protein
MKMYCKILCHWSLSPLLKAGFIIFFSFFPLFAVARVKIQHDSKSHTIRIQDIKGNLVLNINYQNKCVVDYLKTYDYTPGFNSKGVFSSVKLDDKWYSTDSGIPVPKITEEADRIIISDIIFGKGNSKINEKWVFQPFDDYIDWTIERTYPGGLTLEDTGFPQWSFSNMDTWTGALTGNGGVAWCRLFDKPDASLGNHTGAVTFWSREKKAAFRIDPVVHAGLQMAVRFSRQPDNSFTLNYTASEEKLRTKHFLSRFIIDRQDIWDAFDVRSIASVTYRLKALNYDSVFYRGEFPGLNGESVGAILNTIARVGVIDENLMGSNNWHIDMGYVCLHEQWVAQMGLAVNDPYYLTNYRKSLDYYRDNAISAEGNVKDRWGYRIWDSEPGTFSNGFYECQWGDLLDSNTDYVINASTLFQMNGDTGWILTHKMQCEKVLAFLMSRDSDNDGLIEAFTSSYKEKKGSDWIDVIWASWENAFINAKLYEALTEWSDVEVVLGDQSKADYFRSLALKCKNRFNQPVNEGGFWSPENNWYVYWRDKDDMIHGDNLVTPVNFMAIAYGICDDRSRQEAILSRIESLMQKEKLFMWPISFFPYKPDEGSGVNYPFPNYENGDIFLAWGEVGIRAYQDFDPSIPVKYIKNVLKQYEKDGLAFQRYDRVKQEGQGNDILANNCLSVVGLYRDIYGIQPKYNRLFLDPHITDELDGTKIKYLLRDKQYDISLSMSGYSVNVNSFTVSYGESFAVDSRDNSLYWYNHEDETPSMKLSEGASSALQLKIVSWNDGNGDAKKWIMKSQNVEMSTEVEVFSLKQGLNYIIYKNGEKYTTSECDSEGKIHFSCTIEPGIGSNFELKY